MRSSLNRQRGQGMTEYIVVVALVALASAAVYQNFGEVLRTQTKAMAHTLAGDDGSTHSTAASTLAGNAQATGYTLRTFGTGGAGAVMGTPGQVSGGSSTSTSTSNVGSKN